MNFLQLIKTSFLASVGKDYGKLRDNLIVYYTIIAVPEVISASNNQ